LPSEESDEQKGRLLSNEEKGLVQQGITDVDGDEETDPPFPQPMTTGKESGLWCTEKITHGRLRPMNDLTISALKKCWFT